MKTLCALLNNQKSQIFVPHPGHYTTICKSGPGPQPIQSKMYHIITYTGLYIWWALRCLLI